VKELIRELNETRRKERYYDVVEAAEKLLKKGPFTLDDIVSYLGVASTKRAKGVLDDYVKTKWLQLSGGKYRKGRNFQAMTEGVTGATRMEIQNHFNKMIKAGKTYRQAVRDTKDVFKLKRLVLSRSGAVVDF